MKNHRNEITFAGERSIEDGLLPLTPEDRELREFIQSQNFDEEDESGKVGGGRVKEEQREEKEEKSQRKEEGDKN